MKKTLIAILASALAISCTNSNCLIQGTISDNDGAKVVLRDLVSGSSDTTLVSNGSFSFKVPASENTLSRVMLLNGRRNSNNCYVIPEAGKIVVNLDSTNCFKSEGPLGNALNAVFAAENAVNDKFVPMVQAAEDSDALQAAYLAYETSYMDCIKAAFEANKTNPVAIYAFRQFYSYIENIAEFDALTEGVGECVKADPLFETVHSSLLALDNTSVGKPFADFTGFDKDGNAIALSDYVGKGKYVLVDFWASWCGPCRQEIPNLISAYKKFGKKITVLGVPVWDQRPDTDVAIEQMGIPYDQIFVGDDRTATEIYGIQGIPQIILFAPDGTIAARDLRGEQIAKTIKSVL